MIHRLYLHADFSTTQHAILRCTLQLFWYKMLHSFSEKNFPTRAALTILSDVPPCAARRQNQNFVILLLLIF